MGGCVGTPLWSRLVPEQHSWRMPEPPVSSMAWGLGSKDERLWCRSCAIAPVLTVWVPAKSRGGLAEDCRGPVSGVNGGQGESLTVLPLRKRSTSGSSLGTACPMKRLQSLRKSY